jgi:hypothetical protein
MNVRLAYTTTSPNPAALAAAPTELGDQLLDPATPVLLYIDAGVRGGTASYGVMLAEGLRRRGYRVGAICHQSADVSFMRDALQAAGVEVHALDEGDLSWRGRLRRLIRLTALMRPYRSGVPSRPARQLRRRWPGHPGRKGGPVCAPSSAPTCSPLSHR